MCLLRIFQRHEILKHLKHLNTIKISTIFSPSFKVYGKNNIVNVFFSALHIWLLVYRYHLHFLQLFITHFHLPFFVIDLIALFVFTIKLDSHIVLFFFYVQNPAVNYRICRHKVHVKNRSSLKNVCFSKYECSFCQKYVLCAPTLRSYFDIVTCILIRILPFAYTELIIF